MESKGAEASASDLKLVAHPRAKSKVWKYFGFDTNAQGCILQWKKIYCRICMAKIAYSGNTSNLSYHLEKNHPEEFCEFVKSNTEQMREAFASAFSKLKPEPSPSSSSMQPTGDAPPGKPESRRQQELTAAVLGLLCEGLYPASIVEEPTFRALLKTAEPRYELPGRRFFSAKAIPERYGAVREAVLKELAEASWCGVSADTWRSEAHGRAYLTLAVHFVGLGAASGLALGSRCLKTFEVPDDNAAEAVTRMLYETFMEWGIGAKVFGATWDGGKDVAQACGLLDVPVRMPCLGHALGAAIRQAFRLPRVAALLARCRKLADYFHQSPVAVAMLVDKQRQQGAAACVPPGGHAAWWGGSLAMLRRLLEQQFAIAAVLLEDSNSHHLMLEATEWTAVERLVALLEPFRQVAEMLAASKFPAISMVKPLLHVLLGTTLRAQDGDSKEIATAKELIAQELARTYQEPPEVDLFLNVATFLDPRYKRLPFLSAFERQQVENRVVEEAKGLLDKCRDGGHVPAEDKPYAAPEEPPAKKPAPPATATPPPGSVVHDMLAEIFCQAGGAEDHEEWHAQVLEELSNFKSQKVLGLAEDPLKWWSDRLALFPVLPRVLEKYWCVAATRVPAERLFGSAATVVGAKRNRLAPALVDQQVFLYENSRTGAAEAEPEAEDEGDWGLDHDHAFAVADGVGSGFFGIRDGAFL